MSANYVIIVAAGLGKRMNNDLPKQFIKINDKEIFLYAIEEFLYFDPKIRIIVVAHKDHIDLLKDILTRNNLNDVTVVTGGETRFNSVKNGLTVIADETA